MTLLLDTNICIAFLTGTDQGVRENLLAARHSDVALCSVVKAELIFGARNSDRVEQNLARLAHFFAPFRSLAFDDEAAQQYGVLRSHLRRRGTPVGGNDMMIAAIALASDATLVTRDQRELSAIPGLRPLGW